jgi:eukaryotic-like serine/threonine-protein kinase
VTPERFATLKHLFAAVAELPPVERAAHLRQLTDDEELIAEILALYAAETGTTHLSAPIAAALASAAVRPPAAGDALGVWRLAGEIGQGGMGSVFLAERNDGHFQQRAAVKFLRGLPHPEALALFTRERQFLATLTHPNIARLLDGGATPQGQPYLVMEYVEGSHIDEHCRRGRLGVRPILILFLTACNAVASAHRHMVIHCDLKPSNLLVDGHGRPVLLDFGIARLAEQVGADGASSGEERRTPGFTPRYASPEQRAHARVSTASDVYSLGVLLGELLEGAADLDRNPTLRRRELAAIVERARREDPAERYPTVDALTADIRSFLDQRQVQALHGRAGYGLRKGLARHRAWVAMAAASALLATGFTYRVVAESRRAHAAEKAARQAEASSRQVSEFLVSIFEGSNPEEDIVDVPTSKLIEQAEARLEAELKGQPATRSDLYGALAKVEANLRHFDKALAHYQRALAIERGQKRPLALARLLDGRAELLYQGFGTGPPEADAREALALWERYAGPEAKETVAAREQLASVLDGARKFAQAEPLYLENVRIGERAGPSPELAATWQELGSCYSRWTRHDHQALAALRRSLALWETLVDETDRRYLSVLQSLGQALGQAGRFEEAERMMRRNLEGERRRVGADGSSVAWSLAELARMLLKAGRGREALRALDEALPIAARRLGVESVDCGVMLNSRAWAAQLVGDDDAAERDFTRALALLGKRWDEADLAVVRHSFGRFLTRIGKLDAAEVQLRAALKARIAALGETSQDVGLSRFALAEWSVKAGKVDQARAELERTRALIPAPSLERRAGFERLEALIQALQGQTPAALRGLEQVERSEKQLWGERDSRYLLGRLDRAQLLARGTPEQKAEGAALASEILAGVRPSLVPDAPVLARLEKLAKNSDSPPQKFRREEGAAIPLPERNPHEQVPVAGEHARPPPRRLHPPAQPSLRACQRVRRAWGRNGLRPSPRYRLLRILPNESRPPRV